MPVRTNIQPGDLVSRRYDIKLGPPLGVVVNRDANGYLDVLWGSQVEHMWDDYDLVRINEIEEDGKELRGRRSRKHQRS